MRRESPTSIQNNPTSKEGSETVLRSLRSTTAWSLCSSNLFLCSLHVNHESVLVVLVTSIGKLAVIRFIQPIARKFESYRKVQPCKNVMTSSAQTTTASRPPTRRG